MHYKNKITPQGINTYADHHSSNAPALLNHLENETYDNMHVPYMLCGQLEGRFLKMLVQMLNAKRCLEIGTFTGYSALSIAEGLPSEGELITIDFDERIREITQRYFMRSPHGHKITFKFGPALTVLPTLKAPFDFIFIDAEKQSYPDFYQQSVELLRPGGIIAIDNALQNGGVVNPDSLATRAVDEMNKQITADPRVENVLLTVRDGIQLVRKR